MSIRCLTLSLHIAALATSDVAPTLLTLSIHLKSVLPQCCVNKVSSPFSTHRRLCYHRDVAITVLTVSIHLKSVLPQCCVNKVSYSFPIHISPCYHSAVAITFLTVKFATAVTVRIRNLAGRSKMGLTQQNVTVRNKRQHNFETVRSGT